MTGPRNVAPLARAAHALIDTVAREVAVMKGDADAAAAAVSLARSKDAVADSMEHASRLRAEHTGAERILRLLGRLARG